MNPEQEFAAALLEIADRVDVFGFEYELAGVAKAVWKQNAELVERLMAGDVPDDVTRGASIWRSKDAATEARWFVLCVDDGLGLRERGTWGSGVPYELEGRHRTSLVERHLSQMLNRENAGRAAYEAHYGLGAELRAGDAEHDGLYSGSTWIGTVARRATGSSDGRKVAHPLRTLERVGLAERDRTQTEPHYRPTARGREVDAILDRIVVARGGSFVPRVQAGITSSESFGLR